eukprot:gnl/MRDRNA2_/MRDRNA2_45113_c0_seq1.p1 gnl/MRDRNA2_/MRDRNA2_45113_c0~~gnl/MRDRNA2_/MRDRNA2_45113_c0_seq1.p1  ORF type:complete len:277 (+),score=55.75 gnl/MRDRNA2_/MRDRNA2_45113_c0_seq1:42-872(+)
MDCCGTRDVKKISKAAGLERSKSGIKAGNSRGMCGLGHGRAEEPPTEVMEKILMRQGSACVTRRDILQQVEAEVDALFNMFDADGSGEVDKGPELTYMISELQKRGFSFGKRLSDDTASSVYAPIRSKRIKNNILRAVEDDDPDSGLSRAEFHDWFFSFVVSRKSNLRVLLHQNEWIMMEIDRIFAEAGEEAGEEGPAESVGPDALDEPLVKIADALGEPAPPPSAIKKFLERADTSGDGELNPLEFRYVLVEVTTWLFHAHFNDSMHPHRQLDDS